MSSAFNVTTKVDRRAGALLNYHMGLIDREGKIFRKEGGSYYCRNFSEPGEADGHGASTDADAAEFDDGSFFQIGYDPSNRFLSKTFNLRFRICIYDVVFHEDFTAKINFRGLKQIETAFFKLKPASEAADALVNDSELIDEIVRCARALDIALVKISYDSSAQSLEISIVPYAGAFLWIKFPPIFFPLKLNKEEMQTLFDLTIHMKKFILSRML